MHETFDSGLTGLAHGYGGFPATVPEAWARMLEAENVMLRQLVCELLCKNESLRLRRVEPGCPVTPLV